MQLHTHQVRRPIDRLKLQMSLPFCRLGATLDAQQPFAVGTDTVAGHPPLVSIPISEFGRWSSASGSAT